MLNAADHYVNRVNRVRLRAEGMAFFDRYALIRKGTAVVDSRGNRTYPESTVESGRCRLRTAGRVQPSEQLIADRVSAVSVYAVDLPLNTEATNKDVILVNDDRRLEIIGVIREGVGDLFATAVAQEKA